MIDHPHDVCPICKGRAKALDKIGDARGFECERHGRFRVSDAIFVLAALENVGTERWETALTRAKARQSDAWAPLVLKEDFVNYSAPVRLQFLGRDHPTQDGANHTLASAAKRFADLPEEQQSAAMIHYNDTAGLTWTSNPLRAADVRELLARPDFPRS